MSLQRENANSSFAPYGEVKSGQFSDEDEQLIKFSRLSLNSHQSSVNSIRSNSSLEVNSIPIIVQPRHSDTFSMRSRNRKGSSQIQWKNSVPGNLTFLNKSLIGKSSLGRNQQFNFHEVCSPYFHKQLSQKSCPVGIQQTENIHGFDKMSKAFQEGEVAQFSQGREKLRKKFLKTKNLLRNLSSYLHKYIKHNPRCKKFISKYFLNKNPDADDLQAEQFYQTFVEWVCEFNLTNFQQYQKIWTEQTKFTSIYRQICYKYYRQDLFCDIQCSRLQTKDTIQQYTPQFIEGLINPKKFTHFKNQ